MAEKEPAHHCHCDLGLSSPLVWQFGAIQPTSVTVWGYPAHYCHCDLGLSSPLIYVFGLSSPQQAVAQSFWTSCKLSCSNIHSECKNCTLNCFLGFPLLGTQRCILDPHFLLHFVQDLLQHQDLEGWGLGSLLSHLASSQLPAMPCWLFLLPWRKWFSSSWLQLHPYLWWKGVLEILPTCSQNSAGMWFFRICCPAQATNCSGMGCPAHGTCSMFFSFLLWHSAIFLFSSILLSYSSSMTMYPFRYKWNIHLNFWQTFSGTLWPGVPEVQEAAICTIEPIKLSEP